MPPPPLMVSLPALAVRKSLPELPVIVSLKFEPSTSLTPPVMVSVPTEPSPVAVPVDRLTFTPPVALLYWICVLPLPVMVSLPPWPWNELKPS